MKSKIWLIGLLLVSPGISEAKFEVKIGGYGQFDYIIYPEATQLDSFCVRRFRLTFDGKLVEEKIFYRGYIDLDGRINPQVREAYIGYDFGSRAKLKLIAGQQLVPFGIDHVMSSSKRIIAERSKVTSELAPARGWGLGDRDIGVTIHGSYFADFVFGIFQAGATIDKDKDKRFSGSFTEGVDNCKDIALRILAKGKELKLSKAFEGLDIGISFYDGGLSTATVPATGEPIKPLPRNRIGVDIAYKFADFSVQAEYISGEDPYNNIKEKKVLAKTIKKSGWYIQLTYKLDELLKGLEIAARHGLWDPDINKPDNEETQFTFAVNWWATKHSRLLFDYTRNFEKPTNSEENILTFRYQITF